MGKIVVGVDGSEESSRALLWAAEEAELRDLALEVAYSYDHLLESGRDPLPTLEGLTMDDIERSRARPGAKSPEEDARQHAKTLVRSLLANVKMEGVDVHRTVVNEGKPAPFLVDLARDAELLVVGSRGRGSFGSMLLGSVSLYCVHHADCPVLIVK